MKKVLITGGDGFIGATLARKLREDGNHNIVVYDTNRGDDIRERGRTRRAIQDSGVSAVFHLAAIADLNWARRYPHGTYRINVEGTWNVALACLGVGIPLYYASTCCVYGNQVNHPVTETALPNPAEIYACSKLAGENVIKGLHTSFGLQYNMMRFATIYGPGTRPALATHIFMGQAIRGESITVHGNGLQTRTLTHVDDLVDAIVAIYRSGIRNETWNLTTTEEVSALQMAQDIKRITESKSDIVHIPDRIGQTYRESISADHIKALTGWEARIRWEDGIQDMHKWFIATGQQKNIYKMP